MQRNLFLAADAEARFGRTLRRALAGSKGSSKEGARERPAKAEDVVRGACGACNPGCSRTALEALIHGSVGRGAKAGCLPVPGACVVAPLTPTAGAPLQVRLYDTLIANTLELNDLAAHVGGAAGEMLLDECAAKVGARVVGRKRCCGPVDVQGLQARATCRRRLAALRA